MSIPTAKLAQRRAKLKCKLDGTSVILRWITWPNGKPAADPTSGAFPNEDDIKLPVNQSVNVRAFVHFISPITSGRRMFAEVDIGDAIVDFPLDLIQITDAGSTSFAVGEITDEIAFSRANRALTEVQDSALGNVISPESLENVSMIFGGRSWVQKEVGEELARCWDTVYGDFNINRAMLMTSNGVVAEAPIAITSPGNDVL